MGRVTKYIKGFIVVGSVFGLLIALPLILKYGLGRGLIGAVVGTILWTAIMASIFIPIDFFCTRNLPPEALSVRQEKKILVRGTLDNVFDKSVEILKSSKATKIIKPLKENQSISARTKASIASLGENIKLEFKFLNQEATEINISSYPVARYTLLDFGKNFKNIDHFSKEIANTFGSSPPTPVA